MDQYEKQEALEYRGEKYLVRDNGSICRTSRPGHPKRRLDDAWTFGRPDDSTGYMHLGSHVVHRIVALAFQEQPSKQHVVDHIDTNRRNNRADNLRWVTRLENLLLNPITLARIVRACGSLDAFFKDPSAIADRDPNFGWMRTVTREEADESRKRLLKWAESDPAPRGGQLGEWVYSPRESSAPSVKWPTFGPRSRGGQLGEWEYGYGESNASSLDTVRDKPSLTPMAVQRNWKTLGEFPACPNSMGADPLGEYAARLKPGTVFCTNTYGDTLTEAADRGAAVLAVLCRMSETSVKPWALSKITVENGGFVHESVGTYFTLEGGLNAYSKLLGIYGPYEATFDDYC